MPVQIGSKIRTALHILGPLAIALVAIAMPAQALRAQEPTGQPLAELTGYAVLQPDTFEEGIPSGQFNGDGTKASQPRFPAQPVQGFSGVQFGSSCESYWVLSDNGYGSKFNSIDYLLRLHEIAPTLRTAPGEAQSVAVNQYIEFSDPAGFVPFFIVREYTAERLLTGFDFDVESFVIGSDGTIWVGEEFGPYLLHFDSAGRLLEPPIATPLLTGEEGALVRSPNNLGIFASSPNPGGVTQANLGGSKGFEGLAISPDGNTLYPLLEGTVAGDPEGALRIYEFDVQAGQYVTDTLRYFQLEDPGHAIGDFTVVNQNEFLIIERDNLQGADAQFKKIFLVNLAETDADGVVSKTELVDLMNIADPQNLAGLGATFTFPFVTIEDVLVLDSETIIVLNDNNYDARGGRGATVKDPDEFLRLKLSTPLTPAEGVGIPDGCK